MVAIDGVNDGATERRPEKNKKKWVSHKAAEQGLPSAWVFFYHRPPGLRSTFDGVFHYCASVGQGHLPLNVVASTKTAGSGRKQKGVSHKSS